MAIAEAGIVHPALKAYRRAVLPGKIRRARPAKIHFGCGEIADSRFINVDARPFPHVDYVTNSPFMPALQWGCAELIYACHVFEHISWQQQEYVLRRWADLLMPRGKLLLSVPDFDKITRLYAAGGRDFEWMQAVLMGGQDYPGNFHFALFTHERLKVLLETSGFTNVRSWHPSEQQNWPKDWSWDATLSLNLCADRDV
jgi:predicted SAM-dependent methyltransferase